MLNGREHYARTHQRGGIAAMRDRFNRGRNLKTAEVSSAKDVSGVGWGRHEFDVYWDGGVQADAGSFYCRAERCLLNQVGINLPIGFSIQIQERINSEQCMCR